MTKEEVQVREWVEAYLKHTAPIRWVQWWSRCSDPDAKRLLQSVLFEGDHLRDLTCADVKVAVLEVVWQAQALLDLVVADLADEVRQQGGENVGTATHETEKTKAK